MGLAVSNQRETVVAWDATDGRPVGPAISWQDQRGDATCRALATEPNRELVRLLSGLELGSMFSASKIAWFLERYGSSSSLRLGTVDAWLLDRLTGGATYATEAGNASRTLLFGIEAQSWSRPLGELFGVDVTRLGEVRSSVGPWGCTKGVPELPDGIPILAVLGDSHAALYGHWALAPEHSGVGKATYGTGSSVMVPTDRAVRRVGGVATTLAWQAPEPLWAMEGNILYAGAGMDWLARTIGCNPGKDFSELAVEATDSRGAVFVPALNGLGAPWWEASAVGTLTGLTSATTRAEVAPRRDRGGGPPGLRHRRGDGRDGRRARPARRWRRDQLSGADAGPGRSAGTQPAGLQHHRHLCSGRGGARLPGRRYPVHPWA